MIASIHIADVGALGGLRLLRSQPTTSTAPGLRYAALMAAAPLSESRLPRPGPGRIGMFAAWESEGALDQFLARDPLAAALSHGWCARLRPTHVFGAWPSLGEILGEEPPMADDEPAAVLTLGRLRFSQAVRFLRASAAAERLAVANPALLRGTGLARPPALVATFTLWQSTAAMRAYASGRHGRGHRDAVSSHAARAFHHESVFLRFRPYDSQGSWDGVEPLSAARAAPQPAASVAQEPR
ncbi:MAG: spheroidene monooxygenase [Solirubrobacterales bacterium]|nr:spheroidene monooxygenase [Solirubrobacterales bacterium]